MDTSKAEVVTTEEERENQNFLQLIVETPVMQEAQRFLVARGRAPSSKEEFKKKLYNIWFKLYRRANEIGLIGSSLYELYLNWNVERSVRYTLCGKGAVISFVSCGFTYCGLETTARENQTVLHYFVILLVQLCELSYSVLGKDQNYKQEKLYHTSCGIWVWGWYRHKHNYE